MSLVVLDSNVLIYAIDGVDSKRVEATRLINSLLSSETYSAVTSELLLVELTGHSSLSEKEAADLAKKIPILVSEMKPVSYDVLWIASRLRRQRNMSTPDAIHIATAVACKADYFITEDVVVLKHKTIEGVKCVTIGQALKNLHR